MTQRQQVLSTKAPLGEIQPIGSANNGGGEGGSIPGQEQPSVIGAQSAPRLCGNCGVWGPNFYRRYKNFPVNTTCAADAVMDLPASFIPNRQTMRADDGAGCIAWQPKEGSARTVEKSRADLNPLLKATEGAAG